MKRLPPVAIVAFLAATAMAAFLPPLLVRSDTTDASTAFLIVFPVSGLIYAWSVLRMLGAPGERKRVLTVSIFLVLWCFGVFVSDFVSRFTLRRKPDYSYLQERVDAQREATPLE